MWRLAAGWLIVVPAWAALVVLHHSHGAGGVLALLVLVWVADIVAYVVGSRFGRRRLASRVSPGKSWEGLLAALVAAGLVAVSTAVWVGIRPEQRMLYVALAATVAAISVLGDLTESLFKRVAGVKDSGSILPGHGGVLDRIDSLTAAAPAFAFGLHWLEAST
jgi:phosphatidate cytidylyltransferase